MAELRGLPPFGIGRIFTEAGIDPFLFVLIVWVSGAYLLGVWTLHRRGDSWPVARTISFVVLGMGTFAVAVMSGVGAYDTVLLSVHMVQHMVLSMVVPLFLALGAPVTLGLRTLPTRPGTGSTPTIGQKNSAPTSTRCTCIISWTYSHRSDASYHDVK